MTRIAIAQTWNGLPAAQGESVKLELNVVEERLVVRVDAPWHGDRPPPTAAGRCDGLWEYEVVELFLLGERERYLELELGPAGHYLALALEGRRQRVRGDVPVDVHCERRSERWHAEASLSCRELPPGLHAFNAYAIHGTGPARRYLAYHPLPGARPDFHQLERFPPLPESLGLLIGGRHGASGAPGI